MGAAGGMEADAEELARLNLSFLRFRVGALWKEAEGAGGRFFGLEGHAFLRRARCDEAQAQESWQSLIGMIKRLRMLKRSACKRCC